MPNSKNPKNPKNSKPNSKIPLEELKRIYKSKERKLTYKEMSRINGAKGPVQRQKNRLAPKGLSLKKRLKVLEEIIMDSEQKSSDRLSAIKTMTELLSDKVEKDKSGASITQIKFEGLDDKDLEESKARFEKYDTEQALEYGEGGEISNNPDYKDLAPSNPSTEKHMSKQGENIPNPDNSSTPDNTNTTQSEGFTTNKESLDTESVEAEDDTEDNDLFTVIHEGS